MVIYSVKGYNIHSRADNSVSETQTAELRFFGHDHDQNLIFRYVYEPFEESAEVSLMEYDLALNGSHLNDGPLPEQIEVFDLSWASATGGQTAQVMNFTFNDPATGGWRDMLFSVGGHALPDLTRVSDVRAFLQNASMTLPETDEPGTLYSVALDQIVGVEVSGFLDDFMGDDAADSFNFRSANNSTNETQAEDLPLQSTPDPVDAPAEHWDIVLDLPSEVTPNSGFDDLG